MIKGIGLKQRKLLFILMLTIIPVMILAGCGTSPAVSETAEATSAKASAPTGTVTPVPTATPTPTVTPTPEPEPVSSLEFPGKYENTIEDDKGKVYLAYNTPFERRVESKVTKEPGDENITKIDFLMQWDGEEGWNFLSITYRKGAWNKEEKTRKILNTPKESEELRRLTGGEEIQVKKYRIANQFDDIHTDIGDFSYYRIYSGDVGTSENRRFTEEAFLTIGDDHIYAVKYTDGTEEYNEDIPDAPLPDMIRVIFNDVSYKEKLAAEGAYKPKFEFADIKGLGYGESENRITVANTDRNKWLEDHGISITPQGDDVVHTTEFSNDRKTVGEIDIPSSTKIEETTEGCVKGYKKIICTSVRKFPGDKNVILSNECFDRYSGTLYSAYQGEKLVNLRNGQTHSDTYSVTLVIGGRPYDITMEQHDEDVNSVWTKVDTITCPEDYDGFVYYIGYGKMEDAMIDDEKGFNTIEEVTGFEENIDKSFFYTYTND